MCPLPVSDPALRSLPCLSGLSYGSQCARELGTMSPGLCASPLQVSVFLCFCLSASPSCLRPHLIHPWHMPCLRASDLPVSSGVGQHSGLLLSPHCHCPVCDSCGWVSLPRCGSDPVSVSLRGSLSVAKVTGASMSGLVSFGVTLCVCRLCATPLPQVWPPWAMFTLPPADDFCPARGGADPPVCPASSPQDVPQTLSPPTSPPSGHPWVRTQASRAAGVGLQRGGGWPVRAPE